MRREFAFEPPTIEAMKLL